MASRCTGAGVVLLQRGAWRCWSPGYVGRGQAYYWLRARKRAGAAGPGAQAADGRSSSAGCCYLAGDGLQWAEVLKRPKKRRKPWHR